MLRWSAQRLELLGEPIKIIELLERLVVEVLPGALLPPGLSGSIPCWRGHRQVSGVSGRLPLEVLDWRGDGVKLVGHG